MYRIGIIGSENSHAMAFSEIYNQQETQKYPDLQVTAVYGEDSQASQAIQEKCGAAAVTKPEDMLGKVDAIMITSRDGALHLPYARPFIEAGLPLFVDKPLTRQIEEAQTLIRLAQEKGVLLMGGSSLKYADGLAELKIWAGNAELRGADLGAPVSLQNEYGGFFFYASHLAEMTMALFGWHPQFIQAWRTDRGVTAMIRFPKCIVTNHFNEGNYDYTVTLYGKDQTIYRKLDVSRIYQHECERFACMLRSGRMEQSYEELAMPVAYMAAIEKSMESGRPIELGFGQN